MKRRGGVDMEKKADSGGRSATIRTIGDQGRCETCGRQSTMGIKPVPNREL